jgi:pimeloyl-ACP methyl ester carboxylesterase
MSRGVFAEALRLILYSRFGSARVPLLIHRAAEGDWMPFGATALPALQAAVYARSGAYLTITCTESVPTITEEEIARETRDTFLGDYRTRRHQQACQEWPRAKVAADYYKPVESDVPVLMFSTEFDPATPPDFGRAAAQSLPNSRQLIIRDRTHDYGSVCLETVAAKFIASASTKEADTACIDGLHAPEFATALPP